MLNAVKYQWELFLLALGFFSRIPIPKATPFSVVRLNQAGRYFSLVGLFLGSLCGLSYLLFSSVFPPSLCILLMMSVSLMLTGAFHEDGLTDMADGLGGGTTPERCLSIMKDSRIGTYGASALFMALLTKYVTLSHLAAHTPIWPVLLVGYGLSRAVAASLIYDMRYVSHDEQSKSKPLASQQSTPELITLLLFGLLPCIGLDPILCVLLGVVCFILRQCFKMWLVKKIGGFTGDCLGGLQQITELVIYLVWIAYIG